MKSDLRLIKGKETKQKLLDAALFILAHEGYSSLSVKKITDKAGVSKSNLFHHFSNVDDIMASLFSYITDIMFVPSENLSFSNLEDFFNKLGENTFGLKPDEQTTFMALLQYYQIALVNIEYRDRLVQIKARVMQMFKEVIMSIEPVKETRLDSIIENIVISIDALGMYHMMEKDSEKFIMLWKNQSDMFCRYLRE